MSKTAFEISQDEGVYSMEPGPSGLNSFFEQSQSLNASSLNHSYKQRNSCGFQHSKSSRYSSQNYYSSEKNAGIIKKLTAKNFMCHSHLVLDFNSKTNFIVGLNGSGKSAIQNALSIVLGAKANATQRALSLKNFIKVGCHSCTLELVLHNEGERAFKPHIYGKEIIIVRTMLDSGSSSFKLKNDRGVVVCSKKDELENMVSCLKIQVTNPIAILNQDTARSFISSTDSSKKYRFFVEATQITEMEELLQIINTDEEAIKHTLDIRSEELDVLKKELEDLIKKIRRLEQAEDMRNKKNSLENEWVWAKVNKCRSGISEHENSLTNQLNHRQQLQETLTSKKELKQKLSDKIEEYKKILTEAHTKDKERINACTLARENAKSIRNQYNAKSLELQSAQKNLKNKRNDLKETQDEIARLESLESQNNSRKEEVKQKKAELNEKLSRLCLENNEIERELQTLKDTETELKSKESAVRESMRQNEHEKRSYHHQLSSLRGARDTSSIYAPYMLKLIDRIDQAHEAGQFRIKPVGPLGKFIKVSDGAWGPAIEHYLGAQMLKSFIVDNSQDMHVLMRIMQEVCGGNNRPTIYCSRFMNKIFDQISHSEARLEGSKNILKALEISDPNVANCMIDNKGIESVLLIENDAEIARLMEDVRNVPKNCSRCINKLCDIYIAAPNYRSYGGLDAKKQHRSQFLQVSITEAQNAIQENLAEINEKMKVYNHELEQIRKLLQENNQKVKSFSHLRESKRKEITEIKTKISKLEEEGDTQEYRLNILRDEKLGFEAEILAMDKTYEKLQVEVSNLQNDAENAKREYQQLQVLIQESDQSSITRQKELAEDELRVVVMDSKRIACQIDESTSKISYIEKKISEAQATEKKLIDEAVQVCEEEIPTRDLETVEKDLKAARKYVESVQLEMGATFNELQIELKKKRINFHQLEYSLSELIKTYSKFSALVENRKERFAKNVESTSANVKLQFQIVLQMRKYKGRIIIDHKRKQISIMVHPIDGGKNSVDTESLSGGERSYSSVAFIMALWRVTDLPFYSMDEFDVFMDPVNRNAIINLLLLTTKDKPKSQFIFITPLDCSKLNPSNELSIYRMEDPKRTEKSTQE